MARKKRKPARRPYERLHRSVRNKSSRGGVKPRLIVLHTTESHNRPGNSDLESILSWFDNPSSQASSHVIVDGEGRSAQCVPDDWKAWTQSHFNSWSLSIEQIGFASTVKNVWKKSYRAQLKKVAKYIAYWSKKYDIPIRKGQTQGYRVIKSGVVTHASLGSAGGGHHDPGRGYPFWAVLAMARYYSRRGWPH